MWSEELLEQFVLLASEELRGNWVLCGASVLPLIGVKTRTTWDIDLFGLNNPTQNESFKLMSIAESLGIPVECVNLSGGYYLTKLPEYKKHLVLLQEGRSKIFRPDFFLFSCLKTQRFTEVDLLDCQDFFDFEKDKNPNIKNIMQSFIIKELPKTKQAQKAKRLVEFLNYLEK